MSLWLSGRVSERGIRTSERFTLVTRRKTSFSVPQYVSQNFLPFRRSGNLTETHPKAIDFAYALKSLKCIKPKYLAKPSLA